MLRQDKRTLGIVRMLWMAQQPMFNHLSNIGEYYIIAYCFNCYYTGKFINFGFWKQMYYNVPVLVKSGIRGGLCYGCLYVFDKPLVQLLVGIIVGILSYFIMAIVTKDETLDDVKQIILKK